MDFPIIKKKKKKKIKKAADIIGWREWISLPELGINRIKAKIDSGARTSALHAFSIEPFKKSGKTRLRFAIHPFQRNNTHVIKCVSDIIDLRWVSDSGGHREERYVIKTPVRVGLQEWPIEITLTNRDTMAFRMLLGRTALNGKYLINPQKSFLIK